MGVDCRLVRADCRGLGDERLEKGSETGAVALEREIIACGCLHGGIAGGLFLYPRSIAAGNRIGDVLQRADERAVIVRHRLFITAPRLRELSAKPSALEDRQGNRPSCVSVSRTRIYQVRQAERRQPYKPFKRDVGKKGRLGRTLVLVCRFDAQPSRDDVRSARRKRNPGSLGKRRLRQRADRAGLDRQAPVRTRATSPA